MRTALGVVLLAHLNEIKLIEEVAGVEGALQF